MYFSYQQNTLSNRIGITSVSYEVFPEIDKVMSKYLTPHILSAEHTEMAQVNRDITVQDVNKINGSFSLNLVFSCV